MHRGGTHLVVCQTTGLLSWLNSHCRSLAQYIRTRPTHHGISGGSFLALERVIGNGRHWVRPHWLAASGQLGWTRGRLTPGDVSYPCASYHTTSDVTGFCAHYHTRPRYLKRHPTLSIQCDKHLFKKFVPSTSSPPPQQKSSWAQVQQFWVYDS